MSHHKTLLPLITLLAVTLACSLPGNIHPSITPTPGTVQEIPTTPSTVVAIVPTATATLGVQYGNISGHVNYPSEFIAPQHVVVYLANDFTTYYAVDTALNQSEYTIQVPQGTYFVVSYLIDGVLSAGYSQAVPCGLSVDCADHSLIPVVVTAGQTVDNIDVFDWYAPEGTFPPKP